MCAVPLKGLQKDDLSLEQLQALQKLIKKRIPTGAARRGAKACIVACVTSICLSWFACRLDECLGCRSGC